MSTSPTLPVGKLVLDCELDAQIDNLQRHPLQSVISLPPRWGERPAEYVKRRANVIARIQTPCGRWSANYGADLVDWHAHCRRGSVYGLWSGPLLEWHGESWVEACRTAAYRGGDVSQTGTRSLPGVVPRRWLRGITELESSGTIGPRRGSNQLLQGLEGQE